MKLPNSLTSYDIDYLVSLELKGWMARESGVDVPVCELSGGTTYGDIGKTAAAMST
jgi:hypothetical protein